MRQSSALLLLAVTLYFRYDAQKQGSTHEVTAAQRAGDKLSKDLAQLKRKARTMQLPPPGSSNATLYPPTKLRNSRKTGKAATAQDDFKTQMDRSRLQGGAPVSLIADGLALPLRRSQSTSALRQRKKSSLLTVFEVD